MNPLSRALALATLTLVGLVGMMVVGGAADLLFLAVAIVPLGWGVAAWARQRPCDS